MEILCYNLASKFFTNIHKKYNFLDREPRTGGGMNTTRMMQRVKPPACAQRGPTGQ